jgi:hypothetical protein
MPAKSIVIPVLFIILSVMLLVQGMFSCRQDGTDAELLSEVCFEKQVLPVFQNSCALSGCHDHQGEESEYVLNTYEGILEAVEPGDPLTSPAYTALSAIWSEEMMPPDQPLSMENRTLIRVWIEQGSKKTTCPDTSDYPPDTTDIPPDTTGIEPYVNPRACFDRDIQPVLTANCAFSGCHDNTTRAGDFVFTDYTNTLEAVRSGNPGGSDLYEKIIETDPGDRMPPPPYLPLPAAQRDSIYKWILYGALDELCESGCDTLSAVSYTDFVWPVIYRSCFTCHSGTNPSAGIRLTSWTEVNAVAASGQLPGVLRAEPSYPLMPPGGSLSDCTIKKIQVWIDNGAANNR